MRTRTLDFRKLLKFPWVGEHTTLIILAFIVGILAGVANVVFRTVMGLTHNFIFISGSRLLGVGDGGLHRALLPLLPMAGALLLIPLSLAFPGEVNGYGFSKFLEVVNIRGGVIKARNIFLKIIAPALTIGTGGSAGVEGPIAIIGGAVGSSIGQIVGASQNRMKVLIAAGSAGAIAATFNAPIAGIMFAIEIVLLGNYELASFSAIVISSGIATVISRAVYGPNPAFAVPQYDLRSPLEIPLYIILGVIIGVVAVLYIKVFHKIKDQFDVFRLHPQAKPVLGAFIVGAIGIFLPQVMGNGYEFIDQALDGRILLPTIALLVFFKIIATSVTLGSGGAGGIFAPALFIGAMAGGSFGYLAHYLFPSSTAYAGAYATVGIGSFLAAATHAPLTGMFLLFDVMDTEVITVSKEMLLKDLIKVMIDRDRLYVPVTDDFGNMAGIVSSQDVRLVLFEEKVKRTVTAGQIATEDVIVLTPEDDLNKAMNAFSNKDIEEIPVVEADNPKKVIAMIRRKDLIDAYTREVLKKH